MKKVDFTTFSIKFEGIKLIPSKYVKYLGVYIDENLSWSAHINELSQKLSRANGILAKLRYFALKKTLILVYYAIFYSIIIWLSLCKLQYYILILEVDIQTEYYNDYFLGEVKDISCRQV